MVQAIERMRCERVSSLNTLCFSCTGHAVALFFHSLHILSIVWLAIQAAHSRYYIIYFLCLFPIILFIAAAQRRRFDAFLF